MLTFWRAEKGYKSLMGPGVKQTRGLKLGVIQKQTF